MSDTPRTDALVKLPSGYDNNMRFNHELVAFARTLERELAEKDKEIKTLRKLNSEPYTEAGWKRAREVSTERDAALAELDNEKSAYNQAIENQKTLMSWRDAALAACERMRKVLEHIENHCVVTIPGSGKRDTETEKKVLSILITPSTALHGWVRQEVVMPLIEGLELHEANTPNTPEWRDPERNFISIKLKDAFAARAELERTK